MILTAYAIGLAMLYLIVAIRWALNDTARFRTDIDESIGGWAFDILFYGFFGIFVFTMRLPDAIRGWMHPTNSIN